MTKKTNVPNSLNKSVASIQVAILLNRAAVNLKKKNYREALDLCTEVRSHSIYFTRNLGNI